MPRHWNGQRLRDLRGEIPQAKLARALGVSRSRVIAWEAGEDPRFSNAVAIAELFGVTLDSFIEEERDTPTAPRGTKPPHTDDLAVAAGVGPHEGD